MSTFDIKKFQLILSSFSGTFGMMQGGETIRTIKELPDLGLEPSNVKQKKVYSEIISFSKEQTSMITDMLAFEEKDIAKKYIQIREDERGLVIQLAEPILFGSGTAVLKNEIKPQLKKIGYVLSTIPGLREKPLRVEGHTDNIKIPGGAGSYDSNWELSTMRAVSVLKFLVNESGVDENRGVSATGYGDIRPIAPNEIFKDPVTGQMIDGRALNRRVEIVVLRRKVESKE
jgi:chemotaxis protein MotB